MTRRDFLKAVRFPTWDDIPQAFQKPGWADWRLYGEYIKRAYGRTH